MKLLMLGYRKHSGTFETVSRFLELEKVNFDILYLEDSNEKKLIKDLKKSELFFMVPSVLAGETIVDAHERGICRLESVAAGFVLANKGRILFFAPEDRKLSDIFYGEPTVSTIGAAIAYLRREKKIARSNKLLQDARRIISEAHLSFSSRGFVEAVEYSLYKESQAFLDAGFSTETENEDGVPVLNLAVRNGDLEICRLLMSYGASLNIIARDRCTSPVMDAVTAVKPDIAEILIDNGADLDFRNRNGQTALVVAIGARMEDIADLLIDKGADISIKDSLGMTASEYAKLFSLKDIQQKLTPEENKIELDGSN